MDNKISIINSSDFKDELKSGLAGAYLFFGEEEYIKQFYLSEVRKNVLGTDPDAVFRHKKISCAEFSAEDISEALNTVSFGFVEGKTLCELHEIQFSSLKENELKDLLIALKDITEDVICVIYAVSGDIEEGALPKKPSKILKTVSEVAKLVRFPRETEAKLIKWIAKHFISEKLSFESGVCELMLSTCTKDMYVLSNEIAKLVAFVKADMRTCVTAQDVANVCSKNVEINAFDFTNALIDADTDKALEILADMKQRKEKPLYILSNVTSVISDMYVVRTLAEAGYTDSEISKKIKMHEFRVKLYRMKSQRKSTARIKRLVNLCSEIDIKLKRLYIDDYTELDKLVLYSTMK